MRWSRGPLRSFPLVAVALVVAAGMMLATGGVASAASGGLSYPPRFTKGLPDDSATGDGVTSGSVLCPNGHPHVVGGGVDIEGADPNLDLEVKSTSPSSTSGGGWSISANNSSGSAAQMTIYAICATGDYTYATRTVTIPAGDTNAAKARCPAGRKVIGGGVATHPGDHSVEVFISRPADGSDANSRLDDAWYGAAGNGTDSAVSMRVFAVCAKHGTYTVKVGPSVTVLDFDSATSTVKCPSGTRVTGGGASIDGASTDVELHDSFPIDGPDDDAFADDGWQSTMYNDLSGHTRHMRTYAICKHV